MEEPMSYEDLFENVRQQKNSEFLIDLEWNESELFSLMNQTENKHKMLKELVELRASKGAKSTFAVTIQGDLLNFDYVKIACYFFVKALDYKGVEGTHVIFNGKSGFDVVVPFACMDDESFEYMTFLMTEVFSNELNKRKEFEDSGEFFCETAIAKNEKKMGRGHVTVYFKMLEESSISEIFKVNKNALNSVNCLVEKSKILDFERPFLKDYVDNVRKLKGTEKRKRNFTSDIFSEEILMSVYSCETCGEEFPGPDSLKGHVAMEHDNDLDIMSSEIDFSELGDVGLFPSDQVEEAKKKSYRKKRKNEHKRWSKKQEKKLKLLYGKGMTLHNIAKEMERTPWAVFLRLKKCKITDGAVIRKDMRKRVCQSCMRSLGFKELSWFLKSKKKEFCNDCYLKGENA